MFPLVIFGRSYPEMAINPTYKLYSILHVDFRAAHRKEQRTVSTCLNYAVHLNYIPRNEKGIRYKEV